MKYIVILLLLSSVVDAQDQPPPLTKEQVREKLAAMKKNANAIAVQGQNLAPPAPPPQTAAPATKKKKDKTLVGRSKDAVKSVGKAAKKMK